MPVGKVKWYDHEKGFGFLTQDEGGDVYVRASALPAGVEGLKAGNRVEFGIVQGRKGDQALQVRLLDAPPSLSKATRRSPDEMVAIVEDLIRMLERTEQDYRHSRHPESRTAKSTAALLRALADELEL